ncbi:MAG: hypothetical protein PHC75_10260 [Burkholderiales bacterium]|nr:hypothetical protein [Burkholderiales bacterium]
MSNFFEDIAKKVVNKTVDSFAETAKEKAGQKISELINPKPPAPVPPKLKDEVKHED